MAILNYSFTLFSNSNELAIMCVGRYFKTITPGQFVWLPCTFFDFKQKNP
jgi:hypothetical protein